MEIVKRTLEQTDDEMLDDTIGTIVMHSKINSDLDEQLFNHQLLNFYRAKEKYDESKGMKFNTFLNMYLASRKIDYIRDNKQEEVDTVSLDREEMYFIPDTTDTERDIIIRESLQKVMEIIDEVFTDRQEFIFTETVFNERSLRDIAKDLDIGKSHVHNIYHDCIDIIKDEIGGVLYE